MAKDEPKKKLSDRTQSEDKKIRSDAGKKSVQTRRDNEEKRRKQNEG